MTIRDLYKKILPESVRSWIRLCIRSYLSYQIRKLSGNIVMSGPFKGMKVDLDGIPLGIFLGTMEKEIHPAFVRLSAFSFDQIINVGATEGYYAVGMALKWPQATVYAFEAQEDVYRHQIMKLANDNSVSERVHARGHCGPGELIDLLSQGKPALLMLDVEGDEVKLLDPRAIDGLRQATILVELHDMVIPGCSNIIEERFRDTHNISSYITRPRTLGDFPLRGWAITNSIIGPFAVEAIMERPGPQEYLLMIPKN